MNGDSNRFGTVGGSGFVQNVRYVMSYCAETDDQFLPYFAVTLAYSHEPDDLQFPLGKGDLDPQLVWRGKDDQDWSDLVAQAPPLYIQEKVHPKVLIDDLLRRTESDKATEEHQLNLFADFNGLHHQGRRRGHKDGQGQEDRYSRSPANPRDHADDKSQQQAQENFWNNCQLYGKKLTCQSAGSCSRPCWRRFTLIRWRSGPLLPLNPSQRFGYFPK